MRKEYVFFFVLFGVAAMLTGFTVGFVANYQYIEQGIQARLSHHDAATPKMESVKTASEELDELIEPIVDSGHPSNNSASANVTAASGIVVQPQVDGSDLNIPLSPDDLQSVNAMLDELNVEPAPSESERIRNFQSQTGIAPTGELDSYTLNAIIQQMTVKYAQRSLYGG